jgi:hypothetical protein
LPSAYFVTEPELQSIALTDAERTIPLYHFQPYVYPNDGETLSFCPDTEGHVFLALAEQTFLTNTRQDPGNLVRIADPSAHCNCHGWIFTAGKYVVQDADVLTILTDNGYEAIDDPREGDIAIFLSGRLALHSAFVLQRPTSSKTYLQSKWGPFGVFNHGIGEHPFRGQCVFYRSQRRGHALQIRPAAETKSSHTAM